MNHKISTTIVVLSLIMLAVFANASILATATTDKANLAPDELARLDIKLYNDSDQNVKNVLVQIQADEGITFIDEKKEKTFVTKAVERIGAREEIIIVQGIKAITTKQPSATIYVYFGTESPLRNAAATVVALTELPISMKATSERQNIDGEDTLIIDFKLTNHSKETYYKASAEVIAPQGFIVGEKPVFLDSLKQESEITQKFYVSAPADAQGEQTITLAYGFFDSDGPHYFEKRYTMEFNKPNYGFAVLIGVIVLAIAAFMYARKDEEQKVIGTGEKKK